MTLTLRALVFAIFVCSRTSTNRLGNRRDSRATPACVPDTKSTAILPCPACRSPCDVRGAVARQHQTNASLICHHMPFASMRTCATPSFY